MDLYPGDVVWTDFGSGRGREQEGIRPAVVASSAAFIDAIDSLVYVVPVSTRDRGWPNHIRLGGPTGLGSPSWAMVEQMRSVSRERLLRLSGSVDRQTFEGIRLYLADALDF